MAKKKLVKPKATATFEVRFVAPDLLPERIPLHAVSNALSAVQDLASGRDPFEEQKVAPEKGIGLIVPGLVPSPMGEIVDYAPSWVEVSITLGILALGIFVVTMLIRPALIIEQRFQKAL